MARKPTAKKTTPKIPRKRAKKVDGTFKADDPATPDVNEAYVSHEISRREAQRKVGGGRRVGGRLVG